MKPVHIKLGKRTFVVMFDDEGKPQRIRERKSEVRYGVAKFYEVAYWSVKHHPVGSETTIVARVLAIAEQRKITG